jgi:MFS transporter, OCT family, solute carrier family 22 (organic cation transporter), member 4/5
VVIQLFYGLGVLINVLWYFALRDWQLIYAIFYAVPLMLTIAAVIFFIRDTPICLVMRYPPRQALRDFRFIAKMNNKKSFGVNVDQLTATKAAYELKCQGEGTGGKKRTFSILDLFRFKSLRFMTLILILLQCTIIFEFYAPALMLDQFNLSLFINGMVVGFSELISYPLCYVMITRIKRKHAAYGCFLMTLLCSVILIFIWKQGDTE